MQASLLRDLRSRRFSIRTRWEALLHAEPVLTPLGLPDTLVHLIDTTLEEILVTLETQARQTRARDRSARAQEAPRCPCGRNPLLAYFAAAEQATREALVLAQVALAPIDPNDRDDSLDELNAVLQRISRREIEAFCGVCQFRFPALLAPMEPAALGGN